MKNYTCFICYLTLSILINLQGINTLAAEDLNQDSIKPQPIVIPSFADIVEPLMPAVVNVYTVKYNKKSQRPPANPFEGFPFDSFNNFFEQFDIPFNFDEMYSDPKAVSLGSGFIIDPDGLIVTNYHVISNADEINIKLLDNTELPAKLIGSDQRTDLALLKVESKKPLAHVNFGDSSKSRVGDWVITIGNPFGLGGTVTTGIISSKGRDIDDDRGNIVDDFIQTDAAINRGNSGGPMFNTQGEVIGVNTAIFSPSGTNVGIGFAIPSTTAKSIVEQINRYGKVSRGRLDVIIQDVTGDIAEGLGLKEPNGALVVEVMPNGAADKAGIKTGDVIIEFNGKPITNLRRLQVLVAEAPVNKEARIVIIRNNQHKTLTTKIIENTEDGEPVKLADKHKGNNTVVGSVVINNITFSNITAELRKKFAIGRDVSGVVVTETAKNGKNYNLKIGDVIIAANQQEVNNIEQLRKVYKKAKADQKKHVVMFIKRGSNVSLFVAFPVE